MFMEYLRRIDGNFMDTQSVYEAPAGGPAPNAHGWCGIFRCAKTSPQK